MKRQPVTSSGQLAVGTTAVVAAPALLHCLSLSPAAAASSITVYDNASAASGTILASLESPASVSTVSLPLNSPIFSKFGLTVVIAGAAATGFILYDKET